MPPRAPLARRTAGVLAAALACLTVAPAARGSDAAIGRLSEALRFETVSPADPADFRPGPFVAFRDFVERSFPALHGVLAREVVGGHSLLYTWRGADDAAPMLLTSHYDVVPVPEDTVASWEQPAFGGAVADGFVWGRGALDDKTGVLATLEAVERLVNEGFVPSRTVYLAFGHDEEIGGEAGARAITDLLASRGVHLAWSLDEGMAVISGVMGGLEVPAALIGIAEKGYMSVRLTARAPGGHSSMPPRESAIGRVARAVTRLEASPMPANMDTVAGLTLDGLAPHVDGLQGMALRNRALFGPLVERVLSRSPSTDALQRTTTAVTIMRAGTKENILPRQATATVNFRVLPGDTLEAIETHVRDVIDDPEIEVEVLGGREASHVSSVESAGYEAIATAIGHVFPDAAIAPGLVLGGTDSKHYARIADDAYRFAPLELGLEDSARLHGVNERISLSNYAKAIDFYEVLLRASAGPAAP
jgi:carboxypeptidase PM20D1